MKTARSSFSHGDASARMETLLGGHRAVEYSPGNHALMTRAGFGSSEDYRRTLPLGQSMTERQRRTHRQTAFFEVGGKKINFDFYTSKSGDNYLSDYMRAVSEQRRRLRLMNAPITLYLPKGGNVLELPANMADVTIRGTPGSVVYINNLIMGRGNRNVTARVGVGQLHKRGGDGTLTAESLENLRANNINIRLLGAGDLSHAHIRDVSFTSGVAPQLESARVYGNVNGVAASAAQVDQLTHPHGQYRPVSQVMRGVSSHSAHHARMAARNQLLQPPEPMRRMRDPYALAA